MAVYELPVDPRKVLESVLYIAHRLKDVPKRETPEPSLHEVLKIRYFADKLHLARFGFPASGDDYVAMRFGPVASLTYDLLKVARGEENHLRERVLPLVRDALAVDANEPHGVFPKRNADLDWLAPSDREVLDEAIYRYGGMTFDERTKLSHDAAWKEAWEEAQRSKRKQSSMPLRSIASTLPNADEVIAYLDD